MKSNLTMLLSALVANRKAYFDLVESLERATSCTIDVFALQGAIDSQYDGRESITRKEAEALLVLVVQSPARPQHP